MLTARIFTTKTVGPSGFVFTLLPTIIITYSRNILSKTVQVNFIIFLWDILIHVTHEKVMDEVAFWSYFFPVLYYNTRPLGSREQRVLQSFKQTSLFNKHTIRDLSYNLRSSNRDYKEDIVIQYLSILILSIAAGLIIYTLTL